MFFRKASSAPLRYVACVSYPRSGHHLTVRIVKHYFRDEFKYCSFYETGSEGCCRSFPCQDSSVTMTKNHDMEVLQPDGGLEKLPSIPYLVLVRNFLDAVVSDYQLFLREHTDSREAWEGFSQRKATYYRAFVQKWAIASDNLEKVIVRYEDLTDNSLNTFSRIVKLFAPQRQVKSWHLKRLIENAALEDVKPDATKVIKHFGVHNRRRIEDFHHFCPEYFGRLEEMVSAELFALGYTPRFDGFSANRAA